MNQIFQEQLIGRLPIATQGMFPETITITITIIEHRQLMAHELYQYCKQDMPRGEFLCTLDLRQLAP